MTQLSTRELALAWWRGLSSDEKLVMVKKHFPNSELFLIDSSSSKIEQIYLKENE
jgi:hypothetical protein